MFPSTIHFLFCSLITYQRPCLFHVPLFEVVSCYLWYQLATRQRYMYQALTRKVKKKVSILIAVDSVENDSSLHQLWINWYLECFLKVHPHLGVTERLLWPNILSVYLVLRRCDAYFFIAASRVCGLQVCIAGSTDGIVPRDNFLE